MQDKQAVPIKNKFIRQNELYNIINQQMSEKEEINEFIYQAEKIRQMNRTSCVELQNYLYYQYLKVTGEKEASFVCGTCGVAKSTVKAHFKRAFKTLSKVERAKFYLQSAKCLERAINQMNSKNTEVELLELESKKGKKVDKSKSVKTSVYIKDGSVYKKWTNIQVQILRDQRVIKLLHNKEEIDLHRYIMRQSMNKERDAFCLQCTDPEITETIRLSKDKKFQQLIQELIQEAQFDYVKELLRKENKYPKKKKQKIKLMKTSMKVESDPVTLLLTKRSEEDTVSIRKSIEEAEKTETMSASNYEKIQNNLISNEIAASLSTFKNFNEVSQGVYYEKEGRKVRKFFQFSRNQITEHQIIQLLDDVEQFKKRKPSIISVKLMNSFPAQKTKLYKQLDHFGEEDIEFVYLRHYFSKGHVHYFFDKSVEVEALSHPKIETIARGSISHCIWRIRSVGNVIELLVQIDISYNKKIKNRMEITSKYLGNFDIINTMKKQVLDEEMEDDFSFDTADFQNQSISQITDQANKENVEEIFYTVEGTFQDDFSDTLMGSFEEPNHYMEIKNFQKKKKNYVQEKPVKSIPQPDNCLSHQYLLSPLSKAQPVYIKEKDGKHWLWNDEWNLTKEGEVININYEKIKVQSSVLKLVLKNIGKNLISGKNILNTSLPIQIFGTDSYLERLCRGFVFAPRFLEKAAKCKSAIERMSQVICFGWGFSVAYIKMEKPFNPILGQTYQGIIDGCPVYAEQISHHPPISSLLMKGRGYTLYGSFEAKVEMGINGASGINEGFLSVSFDQSDLKKDRVRFNIPPGQMSGLVYGDRKLNLVKQSIYVDEKNSLVCLINWGKNKAAGNAYGKYYDYFEGNIVKTRKDVSLANPKEIKLKPQNIEQHFGKINGRWTKFISFCDEQIFDIQKEIPFAIENYTPSLPSDSRFRKDLMIRKQQNFDLAQQAKEELEQIQRGDRKLRSQLGK